MDQSTGVCPTDTCNYHCFNYQYAEDDGFGVTGDAPKCPKHRFLPLFTVQYKCQKGRAPIIKNRPNFAYLTCGIVSTVANDPGGHMGPAKKIPKIEKIIFNKTLTIHLGGLKQMRSMDKRGAPPLF